MLFSVLNSVASVMRRIGWGGGLPGCREVGSSLTSPPSGFLNAGMAEGEMCGVITATAGRNSTYRQESSSWYK